MAAPRPKPKTDPQRRAVLAKVHLAKKQLALHDDSYRAILARITGRDSAGACDLGQLDALLAEFRRLGWKEPKGRGGRGRKAETPAELIRALWASMRTLVSDPSEGALRAFCARQSKSAAHPAGIEVPEFLPAGAAGKVVEGLKAWKRRELAKAERGGHAA